MTIRAITIDFWGTLLLDGPGSDERYRSRRVTDVGKILAAGGREFANAALDRAYGESGAYLARMWSTHRDVPVEAHVSAILRALDPDLEAALSPEVRSALIDAYVRPATLVPPTVDPGALGALDALSNRGYSLAVVSNTMRTPGVGLRKLLERFHLLGYFKATMFSDEIGIRKPEPEIFRRTLGILGVDAEQAVHVGDDVSLDVRGGRAAGMRVIQVRSAPVKVRGVQGPDAVIPNLEGLPDAIAALARAGERAEPAKWPGAAGEPTAPGKEVKG
jgi:HAD superfamily hydrolase (TIGR01509 family)